MTFAWIEVSHYRCVAFISKPHGGRYEFKPIRRNKKPYFSHFLFRRKILDGRNLEHDLERNITPRWWNDTLISWIERWSTRRTAAVDHVLTIRWCC